MHVSKCSWGSYPTVGKPQLLRTEFPHPLEEIRCFSQVFFNPVCPDFSPFFIIKFVVTAFFDRLGFHTSDGDSNSPGSLFAVKSHLTESLLSHRI